ncbi:MAG: hypothetical protein RL113_1287, partial [Pseudomonadota bacterium]
MKQTITKLRSLLTRRDKQILVVLFAFSVVMSLIETAGISVIMPFISVATDFTLIHDNRYYAFVYDLFDFQTDAQFVVLFGVVLILFYLFRGGMNLLYFYALSKFTEGRYHLLAYRLFENYMGLPYQEFVKKNSSTMTKSIVNEASHLTKLISSLLLMMSEVCIVVLIYAMMLYVNYKITFLLTIVLLFNALFMVKTVSKKIKKAGALSVEVQKRFYEIINRSFGNFKLIKLQSHDNDLLKKFADASHQYAGANITHQTLGHVPRLFLEAIGFGIIVFIITYLVWKNQHDVSNV